MVKGTTIDKITKEKLKKFIEEYVTAYREIVDKKFPDAKDKFTLYKNFPYAVKAYISDNSTLLLFQFDEPSFGIDVSQVESIPDWRSLSGRVKVFSNKYLLRVLDKAQDIAEQEITAQLICEETRRMEEECLAEGYEKHLAKVEEEASKAFESMINSKIENCSEYFDAIYDVKVKTLEEHKYKIGDARSLIKMHHGMFEIYTQWVYLFSIDAVGLEEKLNNGVISEELKKMLEPKELPENATIKKENNGEWRILDKEERSYKKTYIIKKENGKLNSYTWPDALFWVFDDIIQSIESSFLLAIHGMYMPAMALLRRWLEIMEYALYYELKPNGKEKWLNGERTSPEELMSTLTDTIDNKAAQISRYISSESNQNSFREYVQEVYRDLCRYAHYGGIDRTIENIGFVDYDPELFDKWYKRFQQINEICNILLLLHFPEILDLYENKKGRFHFLSENQIQQIRNCRI